MPVVKLSVSLDPQVAELAESRAKELKKPLSRYLAELVEQDARTAKDALAAEGYRLMAAEMHEFAELSAGCAADWWPEWEESNAGEPTETR